MKKLLLCASLCFLFLQACQTDHCETPFGEGGILDITQPDVSALCNVGGAVMINRGHKGIMVTRMNYNDFVAFECTCPNDTDVRLQADAVFGSSVLTCPTCGSRFSSLNGTPFDGAATPCPLYEYNTIFDGQYLTIY